MHGTPTSVDQASTTSGQAPPPQWPRYLVLCALLPLGIAGALALSAAATIDLAEAQKVPAAVRPAAVGMLEVVSAAGTLLAIFGATARLRWRAMVGVVAASSVSLVAGVKAYGAFGAVAPLLLVWLVHLAAEAYGELRTERAAHRAPAAAVGPPTVEVVEPVVPPATDIVEDLGEGGDEAAVEPVVDVVADVVAPTLGEEHGPRPAPTGPDHDRPLRLLDAVREVLDREPEVGDRRLVAELDLATRHQARTLLRQARTGLTAVSA